MKTLRRQRHWIGTTLAAVFLLTAVMPGLVAAAEGVQLQAHICSPDGAQAPADGLPAFASDDHCQLCPTGFASAPLAGSGQSGLFVYADVRGARLPASAGIPAIRRIELSPLNGRAPPLHI